MVRVDVDTIELPLEGVRAPLVFVVTGRPNETAYQAGRTILVCPEDACALSVAFAALGEAAQAARADAQEARGGDV
jgi:hypothetical protein